MPPLRGDQTGAAAFPSRRTLASIAKRSRLYAFGWTLRDYAQRVWDNSGEDNVLFLAGGIAFNIILAAVPFALLIVTVATTVLPRLNGVQGNSTDAVAGFLDRLMPAHTEEPNSPLHKLLYDVLRAEKKVGIYSGIGFVWFSTRLFGSLRTVLASVFDIEVERGIIPGKIFDIRVTVLSTLLFVASMAMTTYVGMATTRGGGILVTLGIQKSVMGSLEAWFAQVVAFALLGLMFFGLYRFLPVRRVRPASALVAALFTSVMFEVARSVYAIYGSTMKVGSVYTGTLTAIVIVVSWFYYAALIFILGGEIGQVYELRRVRAAQREIFTDES